MELPQFRAYLEIPILTAGARDDGGGESSTQAVVVAARKT